MFLSNKTYLIISDFYFPLNLITHNTNCFQLDLNDIDLERWRDILPLAAELIQSDAEIMTQSPSQTVSIYEALAEILTKPTESLSFLNNNSTDRTPFSVAPISSTTTSTTTTTTTTTSTTPKSVVADDMTKVENSTLSSYSDDFNSNATEKTTTFVYTTTIPNTTPVNIHLSTNPSIPPTKFPIDNITTINLSEMTSFDTTIVTPTDDTSFKNTVQSDITNSVATFAQESSTLVTNNEINDHTNIKVTSSSTPSFISNSPRVSQSNIFAISPASFQKSFDDHTKLPRIDLRTRKIMRKNDQYSTPSFFPVYRPSKNLTTTTESMETSTVMTEIFTTDEIIVTSTPMTLTDNEQMTTENSYEETTLKIMKPSPFKARTKTSTEVPKTLSNIPKRKPPIKNSHKENSLNYSSFKESPSSSENELKAYAIVPNNTVVRKPIRPPNIRDETKLFYGVFPNGTAKRKSSWNGAMVNDEMMSAKGKTTNIDPKKLTNQNSELYKTKINSHVTEKNKRVLFIYLFFYCLGVHRYTRLDKVPFVCFE